jgi:hypothetical protein
MAKKRIYSRFKSHQDSDGDWLPEPGFDMDHHTFIVPDGEEFK